MRGAKMVNLKMLSAVGVVYIGYLRGAFVVGGTSILEPRAPESLATLLILLSDFRPHTRFDSFLCVTFRSC